MPLTKAGHKIMRNMQKQYGKKKGTSVFYAMENSGKLTSKATRKGSSGRTRSKARGHSKKR